jgi:hypothetical protein
LAPGTSRNPKKPKAKQPADELESDYERVQKKILLFFGMLESKLHGHLLPDAEELGRLATALDPERYLRFPVPFPDVKPEIYLVKVLTMPGVTR